MSIKDEIKQKEFRSARQKATVNIIYTHNWIRQKLKFILDEFDITSQQYNVIRILAGAQEPLSTSEIRSRMLDKMSDASRIVERLFKKGIVTKVQSPTDKRLVEVNLNENGFILLTDINKKNDKIDNVLSKLSEEEAEQLSQLLDKIRS